MDFKEHCQYTCSSVLEQVRLKGISDDQIRGISASIIEMADKLAQITGDTDTDVKKRLDLAQNLFDRILADLGLMTN